MRSNEVNVKDGKPRDPNSKRPTGRDDDPNAKRRRLGGRDFPEGYVPTLKDIKDKDRSHKGAGVDKTVNQKSAPLLEYPYATQLGMKQTYVKSCVRTFTKGAIARAECDGTKPPWVEPEWALRCKAPVGCGCPLDPIIGTPEKSLE